MLACIPTYTQDWSMMTVTRFLATACLMMSCLCGEESVTISSDSAVRQAPVETIASIPELNTNGSTTPSPATVAKPDFQVESTQVKLLDVIEAPPMHGLPPVEGTITLTVNRVADPGIPDPPAPVPANPITDPEILARLAARHAEFRKTRIVFVSATVYDRKRARVTVYPNGGMDRAVTIWSNVDFNHFCGFGCFEAKDGTNGDLRKYDLFLGISNEDTVMRAKRFSERGIEYVAPSIPPIPEGEPAFVIETENPDPDSLKLIQDMHALYRAEGTRMAESEVKRNLEYEERKAYLLANPPKPKDVTVHFWQRTVDENTATEKGGEP